MAINIITAATKAAKQNGTFAIDLSFQDEEGDAVTPTTVNWTLRNSDGEIVNSRNTVSLTPAASIELVLSGDDLPADEADGEYSHLWIIVAGTYSSDLGEGIPFSDQVRISVEPRKGG